MPEIPTLSPEMQAIGLPFLAFGLIAGFILGALVAVAVTSMARARLRDSFRSLAGEALDQSSDRFLALAGERLSAVGGALERSSSDELARREAAVEALVRPIRESLARVDEKLHHVETEREGHYASLTKHLELVATSHRELERQTRNLTSSLKTPNVRGRWGEIQLRRVVEMAGMLEHCDFQEQVHLEHEDGRSRPDLIVSLPGGRQVVIDAKAPLHAYLEASECEDETQRKVHLRQHASHVRRHVDDLAGRAYWSKLEASPEFVILFLPGEPFFASALAHDPELIERGVERRVLIAGPTTLIALLRAISYGWQQERMTENAVAVASVGRELHDRLATLNDRFGKLGRKLDAAVEAYNATIGSLESRVWVSARRMADLGVSSAGSVDEIASLERRSRMPSEGPTPPNPSRDTPSAPST